MSNTKYTPGPWAWTGSFFKGSDGKVIVTRSWNDTEAEEAEANAKLIAAAPELIEALEKLVAEWEKVRVITHGSYVFDNVWKRATEAIKKATI